jgi:hypothetical protein
MRRGFFSVREDMQFVMIGRDCGNPLIVVESYPWVALFEFDENSASTESNGVDLPRSIFVHFCGRRGHEIPGMAASPNILWILTTHPPSPVGCGAIETCTPGRLAD